MEPAVFFVLILLILIVYYAFRPKPAASSPLPPGPKPFPIIGNALDIPGSMPWKAFRDLSKKYGTSFYSKHIHSDPNCRIVKVM